jgi:hypothetical protein
VKGEGSYTSVLDGVTVTLTGYGVWPTLVDLGAHVGQWKRRKRVTVRRSMLGVVEVLGARGAVLWKS